MPITPPTLAPSRRRSSTPTLLQMLFVAGHGTGVPLDPPIWIIAPVSPVPAWKVVTNVVPTPEPRPMILVRSGSTQFAPDLRPMIPAGSKMTALGKNARVLPDELLHGLKLQTRA